MPSKKKKSKSSKKLSKKKSTIKKISYPNIKDVSLKSVPYAKVLDKYYSTERKKIDANLKELDIIKLRGYIDLTEKDYIHLRQKREHLESMHSELLKRITFLNKRIAGLRRKKNDKSNISGHVKSLAASARKLELEEKNIKNARNMLIGKEKKILAKIHVLLSEKSASLSPELKSFKKKFMNIEISKDYVLSESQHLISKETSLIYTDLNLLTKISDRTTKQIKKINDQLLKLNKKMSNLMWKKELLEFSEHKMEDQLNIIKKRYKLLENKLIKLIPKR